MSYRNTRGVGSRKIGLSGPRLGDRTIGRSNLGWGGQARRSRPRGGTSIVMVPVTNAKTIIFPYSELEYKFSYKYYKPEHSNGLVSVEEAASFLNTVDNMVAPARTPWGKGLLQLVGVLAFIACLAVLISVPVTFVALTDVNFPTPIVVTAVIFGGFMVFYLLTWCFVQGKRRQIMEECVKNIKGFIDQHADSFRGTNLTWVIPEHFPWWIELWKGEVLTGPKKPDNGTYVLMTKQAGPSTTQVPQQQWAQQGNGSDQEYSQAHFAGTQSSFRSPDQMNGGFSAQSHHQEGGLTMQSNYGGGYTMSNQGGGFSTQPRQGGGFSMGSGGAHPL